MMKRNELITSKITRSGGERSNDPRERRGGGIGYGRCRSNESICACVCVDVCVCVLQSKHTNNKATGKTDVSVVKHAAARARFFIWNNQKYGKTGNMKVACTNILLSNNHYFYHRKNKRRKERGKKRNKTKHIKTHTHTYTNTCASTRLQTNFKAKKACENCCCLKRASRLHVIVSHLVFLNFSVVLVFVFF